MKKFFHILLLLPLLAACVHELPEGNPNVTLTLHLTADEALPEYTAIVWPPVKADVSGTIRYEVRLFRATEHGYEHTPAYTLSFQAPRSEGLARDVKLSVPPHRYLALVWADYGPYYNTASFEQISLDGTYSGCNWDRDAFRGKEELSMADIRTTDATYEATVQLVRPLAQYRVVATDKKAFLQFWAREYSLRHGLAVKSEFQEEDLNNFKVRVVYPQYLPSSLNLFTDRPSDSTVGVSFWTNMQVRTDGNVDLGFDWVMVGPTDGEVVVTLEFYDAEGEYISTVQNIEIPLRRSQITTVEGRLLTSGVDSGIAIDPTFDGEFTIYL